MYKILLVDIDNTLLDFDIAEDNALTKTLLKYNIEPVESIKERFKSINDSLWKKFEKGEITKQKLLTQRFKEFFFELNQTIDESAVNTYYLEMLSTTSVTIPYALEVIENLSKKVKIYPVTNGVYKTQMRRIDGSGLKPYFSDYFVSELVGSFKPEKEFFDYVFKKLGYPNKNEVLLVGDSITADIKGGIDYGIDTCFFNPKNRKSNVSPTYIIKDLRELLELIK